MGEVTRYTNRGFMADYEVGYGKPPKNKQFGQPDGPPTGKTSAQRKAEIEAAELAALVSRDLVKAVHEAIEGASNEEVQQQIRGDVLTLLRNVQDRAHGAPKAYVDNTSSDGSMSPVAGVSDGVLDALRRKHRRRDSR